MHDVDPLLRRRLARLREELTDEGVPIPVDGPAAVPVLTELTYARRPPIHEARVPPYGALVFAGVPDWDASPQVPLLVPGEGVPPPVLRRFADGRSSFVVATPEGLNGLAGFEHSAEDEVAAVRLQRTGAVVVQRTDRGTVRVCTAAGVVLWIGSRWVYKPLADEYVRVVARLAPHADRAVLAGLLELAVHSLAAARVGATLVWNLDGVAPDDPRDGLIELARAITGPPLSVARRAHFPALRSVQSQIDLATVVAADGAVGPIGARLDHSGRAGRLVPAIGGARHTSARRFTFDVPGTIVVVVSESGRVTVFSGGAVAAEIDSGEHEHEQVTSGVDGDNEVHEAVTRVVQCGRCHQPLLVAVWEGDAVPPPSEAEPAQQAHTCPVCTGPLVVEGTRSRVLGVPVRPA